MKNGESLLHNTINVTQDEGNFDVSFFSNNDRHLKIHVDITHYRSESAHC